VERERRRRGIATKFLDWMYANIWTDKKVRLDVLVHNKEAIAFYEAYGFRTGCLRMEK
jgi:ribosomal protein S18 acetylase RimI-like enzyme